mmetsp:Transcript_5474/g.10419  ORF Transcript_5474/g.10419 Transcript_5474/m.10419 type:complete len:151 (+) Transcript_5474:2-454(+)
MTMIRNVLLLAAVLCTSHYNSALAFSQESSSRRQTFASVAATFAGAAAAAVTGFPKPSLAAEDNTVLTDEEMAARVARKMELLQARKSGGGRLVSATDVRSDVNPEAGENLRARSAIENARIAMEKQNEMKNRSKQQKRDDLCEMLGRGC